MLESSEVYSKQGVNGGGSRLWASISSLSQFEWIGKVSVVERRKLGEEVQVPSSVVD